MHRRAWGRKTPEEEARSWHLLNTEGDEMKRGVVGYKGHKQKPASTKKQLSLA